MAAGTAPMLAGDAGPDRCNARGVSDVIQEEKSRGLAAN
jgi:hypothetical protein